MGLVFGYGFCIYHCMTKQVRITFGILLCLLPIMAWANPTTPTASEAGYCIDGSCGGRAPTSNMLSLCEDMKSRAAWAQDWQCSNIAIYDKDDRKSITTNKDPKIDALSDVVGAGSVCNRTFTGTIVKRTNDDADYVVLPAHSFFDRSGKPVLNKEGKPCSEAEMAQAQFYPNLKYLYMDSNLKEFAMRSSQIEWPPINLEAGKEWGTRGEDVLIFKLKPTNGIKLSEEIMPSGRQRGYAKYFVYSNSDVKISDFKNFARVSFHRDSARPLEQSYQTTNIQASAGNGMVYDTSDTWSIASGSPLVGEYAGQVGILGHISTASGEDGDAAAPVIKTQDVAHHRDYNRNISGNQIAQKYNLESVRIDGRMAALHKAQ